MEEDQKNKKENNYGLQLVDLNDDCLECIFERIQDLPNQIQIARCCKRLRNVIVGMWKRQPDYKILDYGELPLQLPNFDDFGYFLKTMRNEFQRLRIRDECLNVFIKEIEEFGIDSFTAIERCEFYDDIIDCYPKERDMEILSKLMPNLKCLYITVPISGQYLTNLTQLEELHLYDERKKEYEIKEEYLKDILLNLKNLRILDIRAFEVSHLKLMPEISECINLQELKLNLNSLKPVLEHVLKLPSLKHLKVQLDDDIDIIRIQNFDTFDYRIYETTEYYKILREKGALLQGIAIDFHFLPVMDTWSSDFYCLNPSNLKLLALCYFDFESSSNEQCLYSPFNSLEILCLRHAQNLEAAMILKILNLCPNLIHLDISFCIDLDTSLLKSMEKILENRQTKLFVYYHMSGLEEEIDENYDYWMSNKYIKLRNDFPPGSDYGLSYVQRGYSFYF